MPNLDAFAWLGIVILFQWTEHDPIPPKLDSLKYAAEKKVSNIKFKEWFPYSSKWTKQNKSTVNLKLVFYAEYRYASTLPALESHVCKVEWNRQILFPHFFGLYIHPLCHIQTLRLWTWQLRTLMTGYCDVYRTLTGWFCWYNADHGWRILSTTWIVTRTFY